MKNPIYKLVLFFSIITTHAANAQWVTLQPTSGFVAWLNNNGFSACLNGNDLDTTCPAVINAKSLWCSFTGITNFNGVQYFDNLDTLYCGYNNLTGVNLPPLPPNLKVLNCSNSQLSVLPALPASLLTLICSINNLNSLPALPQGLRYLNCSDNNLGWLPAMHDSLRYLYCSYNLMGGPFYPLPPYLEHLDLEGNNGIDGLPPLPPTLSKLILGNTDIDSLPTLPAALDSLDLIGTLVTVIPSLPDTMDYIRLYSTYITCLPPIRRIENDFIWTNTMIHCLPNLISVGGNANPAVNSVPICDIYNDDNCPVYWNIMGKAFTDTNTNCFPDSGEVFRSNLKVMLYANNVLQQQTFTNDFGQYAFDTNNGTFQTTVDTASLPFTINCPQTGSQTSIVTNTNLLHFNKNFDLQCKTGFDVGVTGMVELSRRFRPGGYVHLNVLAGDISNLYGFHCAAGESGTIRIVMNGPATITNSAPGPVVPVISNDTILYTVADFDSVNFSEDFGFFVKTDTTAQLNDQICFDVLVTSATSDQDITNNSMNYCFTVVNSFDPNDKTAYPSGLTDTSVHWLTYTVRFQNTGNAPAEHIYIKDTLDNDLDESSIQLLSYSHQPLVQMTGKNIIFNFPNINLADSTSNEPESHGFVQYKVKRNNNTGVGTVITNTAYIYFDYNPPVITNTTTNTIDIVQHVGLTQSGDNFDMFPNPVSSGGIISIISQNASGLLIIRDINGRELLSRMISKEAAIQLPDLSAGIYICSLSDANGWTHTKKMVIR